MRWITAALSVILIAAVVTDCGESDPGQLRVSAAASLKSAFESYASAEFPDDEISQSFAGSDQLTAQIEQGARPDVFASANTRYPQELYEKGLLEKPVVFAANRLVLAVPADGDVHSLDDLAKPGVSVVIGDANVPIGSYTREVLGRLPGAESSAILDNVRSEEPDVTSIVGKLTQGAADAGFVYVTDVRAAADQLRAIQLPDSLQPEVDYGIGVVRGAPDPDLARRFLQGVEPGGAGVRYLRQAGFLPPGR
ncbi:MAG TPA: molybdate ABC transporter substrate-binding protein [Solirubrobacterales bacterium]|jgi:molybdate transport system substrate-binding protein